MKIFSVLFLIGLLNLSESFLLREMPPKQDADVAFFDWGPEEWAWLESEPPATNYWRSPNVMEDQLSSKWVRQQLPSGFDDKGDSMLNTTHAMTGHDTYHRVVFNLSQQQIDTANQFGWVLRVALDNKLAGSLANPQGYVNGVQVPRARPSTHYDEGIYFTDEFHFNNGSMLRVGRNLVACQ